MNLLTKHNLAKALVMTVGLGMGLRSVQAEDAPAAEAPGQAAPAQRGQARNMDAHFAACLVLGNQNEIAASKIASEKASNPKVKAFAEMMIKDHQKYLMELEQFGGRELQGRLSEDQPAPKEAADAPASQAAFTRQPGEFHMQLKRELADQCRASAEKELSSKSGAEFDKCYIGMQLGAHAHMIDELVVLQRHSSPKFQALLKEGQETAEHHMAKAKEIMKSLEDEPQKTAAKD